MKNLATESEKILHGPQTGMAWGEMGLRSFVAARVGAPIAFSVRTPAGANVNPSPSIGCFPQRSQFWRASGQQLCTLTVKDLCWKRNQREQNEYLASPTPFRHQS